MAAARKISAINCLVKQIGLLNLMYNQYLSMIILRKLSALVFDRGKTSRPWPISRCRKDMRCAEPHGAEIPKAIVRDNK
jgi:hypothetical protein